MILKMLPQKYLLILFSLLPPKYLFLYLIIICLYELYVNKAVKNFKIRIFILQLLFCLFNEINFIFFIFFVHNFCFLCYNSQCSKNRSYTYTYCNTPLANGLTWPFFSIKKELLRSFIRLIPINITSMNIKIFPLTP